MDISIVTSLYRSEAFLDDLYARLTRVATRMNLEYEIIFVNDGSPDGCLDRVLRLLPSDPHVRVVDLSRNFGHHVAVSAGYDVTRGRRVFVIDSDLEEDPDWLERFWGEMDRTGADVVYGVQTARKGAFLSNLFAKTFYRLFNLMSEVRIAEDACTARLMTRRYVEALQSLKDKSLFMAGNYAWTGFQQHPVPVEKQEPKGMTTYGFLRRVGLLVRAVTTFTAYPLRLIFLLGVVISLLGGAFGCYLILRKLVDPDSVMSGWASVMASLWFLGGVIIAFLGVIGIYIATAFAEVKDRPRYIVRALHGGTGPPPAGASGGTP